MRKILYFILVAILFIACNNSTKKNIKGDWFCIDNDGTYNEVYIDSISFNFSNENIGRDFYRRAYKKTSDTITFYNKEEIGEGAIIDYVDNDLFNLIFLNDGFILNFKKLKDAKLASDMLVGKITEEEYFWAMEERARNYNNSTKPSN